MRILFKYPTRGRPIIFLKTLHAYLHMLSGKHDCVFLIAMDTDDITMNTDLMKDCISQLDEFHPVATVQYYHDAHDGIVDAVNRRIEENNFDIVMAIADDFLPTIDNYDEIIANAMVESWPNMDGAVYFNDGDCGERFALAPILSQKLYEQQGYFFDPYYKWGEADRALSVELRSRNKLTYFPEVLFVHNGVHHNNDEIYMRTRKARLCDHRRFKQRMRQGYYDSKV